MSDATAYTGVGIRSGPELRLEAPVGGGPDWPGYVYVAETLRSLMPMLERMTGLDPDTERARVVAEARLTYAPADDYDSGDGEW